MSDRTPDPGENTPVFTTKSNPTARVNATSVSALALTTEDSLKYRQATILAKKPGADALSKPTANTGNVQICSGEEVLTGAFELVPGASMELPPNGDLAEYFLAVDTAGDGVCIEYTNSRE